MKKTLIIAASVVLIAAGAYAQEAQAPSPQNTQEIKDAKYTNESVARLSFVEGKAFVQRASDLGYEEGALNMPISEGDRIGTTDGRAEIHFGKGNYIRLDNDTKLDVLNLPKKDDDITRLRVWSGNVYLVVGTLKKEKGIEIHTADSSFYVLDRGVYRVDVRENRETEIQVFQGLIEAAGEEGSTLLKAGQRLEVTEGRFASKPAIVHRRRPTTASTSSTRSRNSVTGRQFAKTLPARGALRLRGRARRVRRVDVPRPLRQRLGPRRDRRRLAALLQRPLDLAAPVRVDLVALRALGLVDLPLRTLALGHRHRLVLDPHEHVGPGLGQLVVG